MRRVNTQHVIVIFGLVFCGVLLIYLYMHNKEAFVIPPDINVDIYVISLRHADRLQHITEQNRKLSTDGSIKMEIFDAVKGDKLDIDDLTKSGVLDKSMQPHDNAKKREIGCYLSHYKMYEKIKAESNKYRQYTIIFEDDIKILTDTFIDDVKSALQKLTDNNIDFDMLFLGTLSNNYGEQAIDNIYYTDKSVNTLAGAHAILINNRNIDKIIENTKYIDNPIDHKLGNLARDDLLTILMLKPGICGQQETLLSTIRDSRVIDNFTP